MAKPICSCAIRIAIYTFIFALNGETLFSQPEQSRVADTSSVSRPQTEMTDTTNAKTPAQPADTSDSAKPTDSFSEVKKWANENEGFIGLIALILTLAAGGGALFRYWRSRKPSPAPAQKKDARSQEQRYLDHLINAHPRQLR